jgi:hypothetical protein
MFLAVPFEPAMLSQLGSQGAQFTWHWASVTPEASRACGRAVAEASQRNRKGIAEAYQRNRKGIAEAYQSSNVLAICDALSPEARAAAMIGE